MANTTKKKTGHIVLFIVLCLLSVIIAFPFIWMVLSSFKKSEEFYYLVPKLLPESFMLGASGNVYALEIIKKRNYPLIFLLEV